MNQALAVATQSTAIAVPSHETASSAVAAQAKALVEARYTVALHRPRDLDTVRERLLKECKRPSFAAVARYRKPIGQGVEGPSIRFAEAAIRCMTNITIETITVYDDREKRIVRVTVTDLESNVPYSQDVTIEKTIERRNSKPGDEVVRTRTNSQGAMVYILVGTEDDILNKQNALLSKAIRTLGMRHIPGDLVDEAMWQVKETQKNQDASDPDGARLKLFDAFGEIGVKVAQLKEYLGHAGDTLTQKELADLRGLYAAIRDGETTWREVMDQLKAKEEGQPAKSEASGSVAKLREATTAKQAKPQGAGVTAQAVHDALVAATTQDALDAAAADISLAPEGERKALSELYQKRTDELSEQ